MLFRSFLMEKELKDYSKFMQWLAKDICDQMNEYFNDYDFMQNIVKILRTTNLTNKLGIKGIEFNPAKNDFKNFYGPFIFNLDRKTLTNINLEEYEDRSTDDYAVYRDKKNLVFTLFETRTFSVNERVNFNSLFDSIFNKDIKDALEEMPAEKRTDFLNIWDILYNKFNITQDLLIKKLVDLGVITFSKEMIAELKKFALKVKKGEV